MKKISILIPCYNEEDSLSILHSELKNTIDSIGEYKWELFFVNDGSKDGTLAVLESLHVKDDRCVYLELSRNFGKEAAMLAGLDYVSGDCVIIMDADMQHPPLAIPKMIKKWEDGFDDVYAKRITRGKEPFWREALSKLYYIILSRSTNIDVLPNVGDFRLLDRQCINALRKLREQGRYTKGMFCYIGFRKTFVEFETQDRIAGTSSMSYKNLFRLALEGIMSYTITPLRIASFCGLLVSFTAFVYAMIILFKTLIYGDPVAGFPTLIIIILFLGGIQLLCLGVIGEYVGRTYNETKNRPVYFARTLNGAKIDDFSSNTTIQ